MTHASNGLGSGFDAPRQVPQTVGREKGKRLGRVVAGIGPRRAGLEIDSEPQELVSALKSRVSREIFRDAVFLGRTPLDRALLISRTTAERAPFALSTSLAWMASLSFFTRDLTKELMSTFRWCLLSFCRIRFRADLWVANQPTSVLVSTCGCAYIIFVWSWSSLKGVLLKSLSLAGDAKGDFSPKSRCFWSVVRVWLRADENSRFLEDPIACRGISFLI